MAIDTDVSVSAAGVIDYTGAAHGAAGAGYYTVLELHRFLGDLADDAQASGDDLVDITQLTPSDRSTDNIITVNSAYTITDTMIEHLYDGTIIQASDNTRWDGMVVIAAEGADVQIIQNGALLAAPSPFWNSIPNGESLKGLNRDVANGISARFLIKTVNAGTPIDGRRIVAYTRVAGNTYSEFKINGTSQGNNVIALQYTNDLNDADDAAGYTDVFIDRTDSTTTVDGVNSTGQNVLNVVSGAVFAAGDFIMVAGDPHEYQIVSIATNALTLNRNLQNATAGGEIVYDLNVGFTQLDVNNDAANEDYYMQWDKGAQSINGFYTRMKYISEFDTTHYIYGLPGNVFRGITHEIDVDTPTGTFAPVEDVSWSGGTGQMLAINSPTAGTKMWIQLLTGVAPTDGQVITGGISGATVTVNVTVTERLISTPFVGVSTGSALIGSYGLALQTSDLATADRVFDLTNTQRQPPNNVTFSVNGVDTTGGEEDVLLVGPKRAAGTTLNDQQFRLNAALTGGEASVTVKVGDGTDPETPGTGTNSETDTPTSGTIRIVGNDNVHHKVTYTGYTVGAGTMTFTGCTGAPAAALDNNVYITYIDKTVATDPEQFTVIYAADRNLFIRVRNGKTNPIKTVETAGTLGNAGGEATINRVTDA